MAGRKRVLLVDDEPDILEAIASWIELNAPEITVLRAPTGASALEQLDQDVDLVVSDYRMPDMDGLTVLAAARARDPEVPTVLMTAYPDRDLAERALDEVGVSRFLVKPVDPDDFLGIVKDMAMRWSEPEVRAEANAHNARVTEGLRSAQP